MFRYFFTAWLLMAILTFTGFCLSQIRWHSDSYLIEAAIRSEIGGGWSNTPAINDVSAYIKEYPQCCSVRSAPDTPVLSAIFLRRFYAVTVKYPVTDPAKNQGAPYYESTLIMDCCGQYGPDRYGMETSTPVPKGHPQYAGRGQKVLPISARSGSPGRTFLPLGCFAEKHGDRYF